MALNQTWPDLMPSIPTNSRFKNLIRFAKLDYQSGVHLNENNYLFRFTGNALALRLQRSVWATERNAYPAPE